MPTTSSLVNEFYKSTELRKDLSFSDIPISESNWGTHSYHSYPAKFSPLLAGHLIELYSKKGQAIWDPFCGSGTVNLESIRKKRSTIGTDINPISVLISKVKTTPLDPKKLEMYSNDLFQAIEKNKHRSVSYFVKEGILNGNLPFLRKWYPEKTLLDLARILYATKNQTMAHQYQSFSLCCFSSILKKTSFWLKTSIKPQFDYSKVPSPAIKAFEESFSRMQKLNKEFYTAFDKQKRDVQVFQHDATMPFHDVEKVDHIITSPPYLVSYENSDIFKLSAHLLTKYENEKYVSFKKKFIGTQLKKNIYRDDEIVQICNRAIGTELVGKKGKLDRSLNYFQDMSMFFENAQNQLKKRGNLVLVVGDATIDGQIIPNAYILSKIAESKGFILREKFRREIGRRNLPGYRDRSTGKFTKLKNTNGVMAHPEEFVLAFQG